MNVINVENLQHTLDHQGNLMNTIQFALINYLTKQSSDFSLFYFLVDDNLLEIITTFEETGYVITRSIK